VVYALLSARRLQRTDKNRVEKSKTVDRFGEEVCAAEYDIDFLNNIPDEMYEKHNARRRCSDGATIEVIISDNKLKKIKKESN